MQQTQWEWQARPALICLHWIFGHSEFGVTSFIIGSFLLLSYFLCNYPTWTRRRRMQLLACNFWSLQMNAMCLSKNPSLGRRQLCFDTFSSACSPSQPLPSDSHSLHFISTSQRSFLVPFFYFFSSSLYLSHFAFTFLCVCLCVL